MNSIYNVVRWIKSSINESKETERSNDVQYVQFTSKDLECFINLLNDDYVINDFLQFDVCSVLADKYLLAMTFVYFIRAELTHDQFNRQNFFSALYLAHEMEEDDESLKLLIIPWYSGRTIYAKKEKLIENELALWKAVNYRTLVSKQACEEVISCIPEANIWQRFRPECHSGANRERRKCTRCYLDMSPDDPFYGFENEDDLYSEQPTKRMRYTDRINSLEYCEDPNAMVTDEDNSPVTFSQDDFRIGEENLRLRDERLEEE